MVGSISVQPQMVQSLAANLGTDSRNIASSLETLEGKINILIGSWEGAAQEAYRSAQVRWNSDLQEMNNILEQISRATSQIADDYVSVDNKAAGRF